MVTGLVTCVAYRVEVPRIPRWRAACTSRGMYAPLLGLVLVLLASAAACGGSVGPPSTRAAPGDEGGSEAQAGAASADAGAGVSDAATCAAAGCTAGFTCGACPPSDVCDDTHGRMSCLSVDALAGCGPGTEFCNSSCGVCQLPGSRCVIDTCDDAVARCGAGASCGRGTRCVDDVCVVE